MATILELLNDEGVVVTRSFQDPVPLFYVEGSPSLPVERKTVAELRVGDRVAAYTPRFDMELVNVRVVF